MAKQKSNEHVEAEIQQLEYIKKLAVISMFSDDELMDQLVLKGGNALDIVLKISTRASVDVDFSMAKDFPGGREALENRVSRALKDTYREAGYEAFDIKTEAKPEEMTGDMAGFWGGYAVEFKLIPSGKFSEMADDIDELRKHALQIGRGKKFLIDISRFEYTEGKEAKDLDGFRIFVYSPTMLACEKLRAICQQMPEYGPIIKRSRPGSARARDFLDIHTLITTFKIDIESEASKVILSHMFFAKKVPLSFIGEIEKFREFHRSDFSSVKDTVKAKVRVEEFDFYFDFVLALVAKLKPLWNV